MAIDAKIASAVMLKAKNLGAYIIQGPTSDNQPVFTWESSPLRHHVLHVSQPGVFNFSWETVSIIF